MDGLGKLQYSDFLAKLQLAQDLLAEGLEICLALVDERGKEITLPSGLPLVCNGHMDSAQCHAALVARQKATGDSSPQRCPLGLYVSVLGTSVGTDDGSVYLLAGRTPDRSQLEKHLELLSALFTLPFKTPSAKRREENGGAAVFPGDALSIQERRVLACVAGGLTNKEIAQRLCITHSTVKAHLSSVFKKLNLSNRTEASVYALKNGLSLEDADG